MTISIAIHRRTGWPIAALWKHPVGDGLDLTNEPTAMHVFCVSPDGQAVDAEGWSEFDEIRDSYLRRGDEPTQYQIEVHGDEKVWAEVAMRKADMLVPRERGIEAAEKVIGQSERFLVQLVDPNSGSPRAYSKGSTRRSALPSL